MFYLIDDADISRIKSITQYFPIHGVTTNPSIIAKGGENVYKKIKEIRDVIGPDLELHAQVLEESLEGMVKEAMQLRDTVGGNFFVKVPVTSEGLKAISVLKELGFNVTATAIFTVQQALLAATAGADYVAPYVNRIDNFSSDGISVVSDIVSLFDRYGYNSKVLAASFKSTQQIHNTAMVGSHAATISCDLFEQLISHPLTDSAIKEFEHNAKDYYNYEK